MNHSCDSINKTKNNFNNLTQSYSKISINTKCGNKKRKLYKRALRILGWPRPRKIRDLWRITIFRNWTWHHYSIFSSIQLHPWKKIQWSCRNMSSLHKNINEIISRGKLDLVLIQNDLESFPMNRGRFPHQNLLISGSGS